MIYKNGNEIKQVFHNSKPISAIYKGVKLVWQSIRSCFGSGAWHNEKPWINDEGWRNNT